jgi:hypothetical protein
VPIALPLPVTFDAENDGTGLPACFVTGGPSSPADADDDDERESTDVAVAPDRSDVELRQENTRPVPAMSQARVQSHFIAWCAA